MDIIALISNALGATKELLGFQSKKLDLNNSPAMQKAAQAQSEVDAANKVEKAIAEKDVDEIRKQLSE